MDSNQQRILKYLLGRLEDLLRLDDEISHDAKRKVLTDLEELNDPESLERLREFIEDKSIDHETRLAIQKTAKTIFVSNRPK
jgi:hypothetical protein